MRTGKGSKGGPVWVDDIKMPKKEDHVDLPRQTGESAMKLTPVGIDIDQRWRIERDYQDLKQDFGLGHYEGRGWRGFHHHASLSIAAYGFLMAERRIAEQSGSSKKKLCRTSA